MEQRQRAIAGERRAEMLQLVRARHVVDTFDQRHLPIGAASLADYGAERAPFAEVARPRPEAETPCRAAEFVEVIAVARGASGQRRREGRRSALEIAARAEDAVRIDHDAGVAHREVLAA